MNTKDWSTLGIGLGLMLMGIAVGAYMKQYAGWTIALIVMWGIVAVLWVITFRTRRKVKPLKGGREQ